MENALKAAAGEALAWFRRSSPGMSVEVYLYKGRTRSIEMRDGRPDMLQECSEEGLGLRVMADGRMGFSYAGSLEPDAWPVLHRAALEQFAHVPPDPHRCLPRPEPAMAQEELAATLNDEGFFQEPLTEWASRLERVQDFALAADPRVRKVLSAGYGESLGEASIASTEGIWTFETGTSCSVGLTVMAEQGGEVQVGSGYCVARRSEGLDLERVARGGVERAARLLGSRRLHSGRRAVIFDPWVAGEFLEVLAVSMSAEVVQRGKSLLRGRLGQRIASEKVTFFDDPRRPGGLASAFYDDEGVPTRRKTMVEGGVLRDLFYDATTARRDDRASNGCAGRPSYRVLPGCTSSNFYLAPGGMTRDALIADTRDGLLVLEVMGMHTADPVSGDLSVGVSGVSIQDGRLGHGVCGAMLSGDLLGLLERVDAVADDLTFYGGFAAPTFRVADVMIGGS